MFFPKAVAPTFTAEQLDAVKRAFGARYHGAHAIDVRLSLPLWRRSVYLVFLIGPERRTFDRRSLERYVHGRPRGRRSADRTARSPRHRERAAQRA
jgi:hypothetical protein